MIETKTGKIISLAIYSGSNLTLNGLCHFLPKSTRIKNLAFPYKTALSKDNVKTNRMRS